MRNHSHSLEVDIHGSTANDIEKRALIFGNRYFADSPFDFSTEATAEVYDGGGDLVCVTARVRLWRLK